MESKLDVLSKIARKIQNHGITWALGGSSLLFLKNIADHFNDIDIMVCEEDINKVKELLLELGELRPFKPNNNFKTKHFLEFLIDNIKVDIMAGFTIVKNNQEYYFPIEKHQKFESIDIDGLKIPLQSVKEWKKYYELMDRTDKVSMINQKTF